jgi:heme oxygenase (biliverdin-IX-beta and delta-forming)
MSVHVRSSPVLESLRRETRASHERLEAGLNLLDPGLTVAEYRRLLERFWGFCLPAERAVEASGAWAALGLDGAERSRTGRLERDLLALGHTRATLPRVSLHPEPPCLAEVPGAVGYLYVLEGATLGGSVIARHLHRTLGIGPDDGAAFFTSYGAALGPMWKQFTQALAAYADRSGAEPFIVRGACETFGSLERWLLRPRA